MHLIYDCNMVNVNKLDTNYFTALATENRQCIKDKSYKKYLK